jgi:glycosyltransferase involved in cell wall biosynthesis
MATILMAAYTNYSRDPRVRREAEALVEAGHRVDFLASRHPGQPSREAIADVEVIRTIGLKNPRTSAVVYMLEYLLFFVMLSLHLLKHPFRYDLVHVNNMPDLLVFATWLHRLRGRPVIHDVHDLMPELFMEKFSSGERHWLVRVLKVQERWAGRFANAVVTVEDRLRDILAARGIPREKIHILMNLPDDRIFAPRAPISAKPPGSRFVLVYHGTLARRLGLDIAIRAVARVVAETPEIELRIIGAGEERDGLLLLRDQLNLQQFVTFSEGFVPVEDIPPLLNDADVGLVPLRISAGTDIMLPTKLLEYVTMGIPCIVPRTRTICRHFDDRMVQFFEAEDVDSLAEAIVTLHRDPQRRIRLAEEATARFSKAHSWKEHKKVYTGLVERLLGASG